MMLKEINLEKIRKTDNIIIHFQKQNNKKTAACSLHVAFDMMAIIYKSLLDTCIKCCTSCSECDDKFGINRFVRQKLRIGQEWKT
jgi:hypothetical protein